MQRTRKQEGPQFREEAGDVLASLVCYLNRDIMKTNRLSYIASARQQISDKHLGKRFSEVEQDLDDKIETLDNIVVYDKKENAIFSVYCYTVAVEFKDKDHQHKRK
ncbi:MAG: hypothetical protein EZS28_039803 [Streblomastix strix]|uniref:Uncharacterized protein n=1 Tax=Streblomastix strix TaxID=222440 RepID=A0A5J4U3H3_9EUKA|nr:MAG: hypothetical protein EZS28_039803 [Streblomastix strix]